MSRPARVLIIAGSDSSGGAGIQADIKTVTMLGGHAMTAVTAITAQNTLGVSAIHLVPAEMVVAQIDAVVGDIGIDAVKIGMVGSASTAHAIAERLEQMPGMPIVFDPVMVSSSGAVLGDDETIAAFERLMDAATVVTPNVPEIMALTGRTVATVDDLEAAAQALQERHGCAVMAKGGHLGTQPDDEQPTVHDLLIAPGKRFEFRNPRIDTRHGHGTGCTLASGIAAGLGSGLAIDAAVDRAEAFVQRALSAAPGFGGGQGPMGHALGVTPFYHLLAALDSDGWDASTFAARWSDDA